MAIELPKDLTPLILQGHVIDVLRTLPEGSIQCVITSPPYWGLRVYCTEQQVWGPNGHAHEWVPTNPRRPRSADDAGGEIQKGNRGASYDAFVAKNWARTGLEGGTPEGQAGPRTEAQGNGNKANYGAAYDAAGGFSCSCGAWKGELGAEPTPELYVAHLADVFDEVRRVLREDGTLWLNLGDTYTTHPAGVTGLKRWKNSTLYRERDMTGAEQAGSFDKRTGALPEKNLVGIPWRVAFELQRRGWCLRSDIIWNKPNPMPESMTDRPTRAHEYVFLLTKSPRYYYDQDAIRTPNPRSDERWAPYGNKAPGVATSRNDGNRQITPSPNGANLKSVWSLESGFAPSTLREVEQGYDGEATKEYDGTGAQDPSETKKRIIDGIRKRQEQGITGPNLKSVWQIATQPYAEAHFATFPEELPERCIKLATSEKGCCATCGAPWERVMTGSNPSKDFNTGDDLSGGAAVTGNPQTSDGLHRNNGGVYPSKVAVGWEPGCKCKASTNGCIVLDPFAGSGTTLHVARRLGRRSIGIELNPDYVKLAKRRAGTNIPDLASWCEPE